MVFEVPNYVAIGGAVLAALFFLFVLSGAADAAFRRYLKRKYRRRTEKQRAAAEARGDLEEDSVAAVFWQRQGVHLNVDGTLERTEPRQEWRFEGKVWDVDGQLCYHWKRMPPRSIPQGAIPATHYYTIPVDEFWGRK